MQTGTKRFAGAPQIYRDCRPQGRARFAQRIRRIYVSSTLAAFVHRCKSMNANSPQQRWRRPTAAIIRNIIMTAVEIGVREKKHARNLAVPSCPCRMYSQDIGTGYRLERKAQQRDSQTSTHRT